MSKKTGITRNVDVLGRVTLPVDFRKAQEIAVGDPVEISMEGESIVIRKHLVCCSLCGYSVDKLVQLYPGKLLCQPCIRDVIENEDRLIKILTSKEEPHASSN